MELKQIIERCREIELERSSSGVFLKLSEEVGELATELNIKYHGAYKEEGGDGIYGECIDAIICLADILNRENVDLVKLDSMLDNKLNKWREKVNEK